MKKMNKILLISALAFTFTLTSGVNVNAVESNIGSNNVLKAPKAVGDTIAATFPDANFAQAVADKVSGGDVNAILTTTMVNGLTTLSINNMNVSDLTGVEVLTKLTRFDFGSNNVTVIPDNIDSLTNLKYLIGNTNDISVIPASIGNLSNLLTLDLSYNYKITEIPDSVYNLNKLTYLDLAFNKISNLSERLGDLTSLKNLSLQYNKIYKLPDSVGNLTNIEVIFLTGNQLTNLPTTINSLTKSWVFEFGENMLPPKYMDIINAFGWANQFNSIAQRRPVVKDGLNVYDITDLAQIDAINLRDTVEMSSSQRGQEKDINPAFTLSLENYVDENGASVDLNTYIINGIVQKTGSVYAQVRLSSGITGLYPADNDNTLSSNKFQFNFTRIEFPLTFDLNGVNATIVPTQNLIQDEVSKVVANPTASGFAFKEWNTKADGTGTTWVLGTDKMGTAPITVYAQWEEVSEENKITPGNGNNALPNSGDSTNIVGLSIILILSSTYLVKRFKLK